MRLCIGSLFIIYCLGIKGSDWDYTNPDEWYKTYPYCGGDTQSPINIELDELDSNCPVTLENGHEALLWSITDLKRTYVIENNGHALEMVPHDLFYKQQQDVNSDYQTAVLRNNFVTESGEHANFCLNTIHIHYGSSDRFGSEHTVNGKRAPMEMHFVHYSCDYDSQTAATSDTNVKDPYVLAVVAVLFEIGDYNIYFEHITNQIDYILNPGDEMIITNADLSDLLPPAATDFIYYEGSLTTPGCDPIVRWHILAEPLSISDRQMALLRRLHGNDHEDTLNLDNNFRPTQDNKNPVYYCTPQKFSQAPIGLARIHDVRRSIYYGTNRYYHNVRIGNSQSIPFINILIVGFAFICLFIGLCIGKHCGFVRQVQKKTFAMNDL